MLKRCFWAFALVLLSGKIFAQHVPLRAQSVGQLDLLEITPAPDRIVQELTFITVIFSESVSGIDAGDLLVNGSPAGKLSTISPREYTFHFLQPSPGPVRIEWQANHGIADLATGAKTFAGEPWAYTLEVPREQANLLITEFLADNEDGIRDDDSDRSDWIELFNAGPLPANLDGWFLTDTATNLTRWRIPSVTIDAGRYLLIWASGKDRADSTAQLHTNFRLEKNGGYLALVDPKTNVVSQFNAYPAQRPNITFGRDVADPTISGYLSHPTPGAANAVGGAGFAPEPIFSQEGGIYTNNISVTLTAPSGQIRYTLDGSVPTSNSPLYTGSLALANSAVIKARVFQNGLLPSAVVAQSYFLVEASVARFSSTIPIMVFTTLGKSVAQDVPPGELRTFASLIAVDAAGGGRSSLTNTPDYFGLAELERRGQSSAGFAKKAYNLELQDEYRNGQGAPLLGMPSGADWVLGNPYSDKPFLQNFLAHELFEKMGHYAVRRRFVEVFVNSTGGKISYPRDYMGIYLLMEKIRIDNDRVDVPELTRYDNKEPKISGGYIFKKDKDSAGDLDFLTVGGANFSGQVLKVHEPKPREMTPQQFTWLKNYITQFEKSLYASNWRTATGTNHYSHYIDVDSFVDFHWIVEFSKQIDGYRISNYMHKDRNGKIHAGPIWDWNLSFGNANYLEGESTSGWYYTQLGEDDHIWLRRLISGTTGANGTTGDPDFNQRIVDRWSQLRTNIFSPANLLARIDEMAAILNEPATRDFQKWPRLGNYVWPNPTIYITPRTYSEVIDVLKNWIQGRYNWIDSQFPKSPNFNQAGGQVLPGFQLAISAPSGSIYYTLDGSDPRMPGGAISPKAILYTGAATLSANAKAVARARSGTRWSGPSVAAFSVAVEKPSITRIRLEGSSRAIVFEAAANQSYMVQYTDFLNPAAWLKLADVSSRSTNFTAIVTDSNPAHRRFYRLVSPAQP